MIVSSATIGAAWFLDGISALQTRQLRTEKELSSGYKVQDASDSPVDVPALVQLGSRLATSQAWQSNLSNVAAESGAADQALTGAINTITSATTLATAGATVTATAASRQNLASQVQTLQQQLVAAANTQFGGRYIFGGAQDQSTPYQLNVTSPTGVDQNTSQTPAGAIQNPAGQTVYQALTASQIFDQQDPGGGPAGNNAFAALSNLATALAANDTTGIADSLTALQGASDWLNQQQAYYGRASQAISGEQNSTANEVTSLQTEISGIRDTDIAAAATDLTQENTAQQALLGAESLVPRKSLFDYLG